MDRDEQDAALVEAARDGDRAAFAALLARHQPLLLAMCRRALGDAGRAEDATQEAVLQALLSLDRLRQPERFGSWLVGIGLNICRRWQQGQGREVWSWEAMLGGRRLPEPVDATPGPADLAEAAELRAWVHRAVAGLPPGQRAAVILHYLAGLTQAETAAHLGVEAGAVKTRLHKARANLRRTLWQHEPSRASSLSEEGVPAMVEVQVLDVRRRRAEEGLASRHFVLLGEVGGERRFPIWIGEAEATALALHLERVSMPRPLTYAFAAQVLTAAGGQVREVRIDRLEGDVFYATCVVAGSGGDREVDARPSDALNLALLLEAPIRVAEEIIESTADCPVDEWSRRDELTDGAAIIAAQVTAGWEEDAQKRRADRDTD
jgi:RNA polymerase sigma factor (sigma-70 family)